MKEFEFDRLRDSPSLCRLLETFPEDKIPVSIFPRYAIVPHQRSFVRS